MHTKGCGLQRQPPPPPPILIHLCAEPVVWEQPYRAPLNELQVRGKMWNPATLWMAYGICTAWVHRSCYDPQHRVDPRFFVCSQCAANGFGAVVVT